MTPEQLALLVARVQLPDCEGLTEEQVANLLLTEDLANGTAWNKVAIKDARSLFRRVLAPGGMEAVGGPKTSLIALQDAANPNNNPLHPAYNIARSALELFSDEDGTIDATDQEEREMVLTMVGIMVMAGLVTEQLQERLVGMLQRGLAWDEANGWVHTRLTSGDVGDARKAIQGGQG